VIPYVPVVVLVVVLAVGPVVVLAVGPVVVLAVGPVVLANLVVLKKEIVPVKNQQLKLFPKEYGRKL
jgi:archaellum biogenesis protein FlaJ (TadC family)